ncbi:MULTISPECIES: YodC family protein [unclassified Pseudomonas]|uniref:YodC family protein n=1 Tax=unclassified Pseudomonas TaxID=196821 RepID=UPI001B338081|nr:MULTISPECIES: DUF2158 domain-containing protein [unclassified Pseudomonas]MBP5947352.1 DUF2158 domain-containing protein [Pseudomonas sp. P9(2020)]MBZ9565505.1 DUF2158 domain-containing protein [Pseudomonas sp. P116]
MSGSQNMQVGTIVKLRSGGPDMTVEEIVRNFTTQQATGDVDCQWFAGKKLEKGRFPVASLELVKHDPKGQ